MNSLVVVVSYNNRTITEQCVNALRNQTDRPRIVVWDNNSPDDTQDWLRQQYDIDSICSDENVLWSPAVNGGINKFLANEQYIGFMNNDIILPSHAIEYMTWMLKSNPEIGLIGPLASAIGGPQEIVANVGHWPDFAAGRPLQEALLSLDHKRVPYLIGACMFLPTKVWKEIGGLDEDMPLGADDHDYSIRVKAAGYELWVNRHVAADHIGHASSNTEKGKQNWDDWGGRSWDVFNKKWAGYYANEEEAIKAHWGGEYHPGWELGTGWLSEEERAAIQKARENG